MTDEYILDSRRYYALDHLARKINELLPDANENVADPEVHKLLTRAYFNVNDECNTLGRRLRQTVKEAKGEHEVRFKAIPGGEMESR